jgi:hypothetical protein
VAAGPGIASFHARTTASDRQPFDMPFSLTEKDTMRTSHRLTLSGMLLALVTAACGGGSNALAPKYQPQVVNTPNVAFSFQATGLQNIDDVVQYTWSCSSGKVVIHPATNTTSGTINLVLRDANGAVVYNGTVPASGDITPPTGAAGNWTVRVTLTGYTGTINFAVQMQ